MRAVRVHEHGDPEVLRLEQIALPEPGPGEVRLRVAWSALNHLDVWVRRGVPGHRFPLPITPGCDFSGTVDVCGPGVTGWPEGTRVCVAPGFASPQSAEAAGGAQHLARDYGIYGETCDGGNADFAVVRAENLLAVPAHFPLDLAAAFPLTFLTAWHMLVERCHTQPWEKVLVHAAGSGVGVAAVQIAKRLGAEVMVTAGSDEKVAQGLANGADVGVNYAREDWAQRVKGWTAKRGVDVIVDHVGRDTLPQGIGLLAKGGRLVTCGVTSGAQMELNFAPIFFKSLSVLGSTMGGLGEMKRVAGLVFAGQLRPVVAARYRLDQVREAHEKLASRTVFGKVLLEVGGAM